MPAARGLACRRGGMVLILVLVVIAMLSLAALTFSEWMLTERQATLVSGRQIEVRALAESGVEATRQFLSMDPQSATDAGGWYDNAAVFCGVLVRDDDSARGRGRFTVLSPAVDQGEFAGTRYGLEDESAKLNLNALLSLEKSGSDVARNLLMGLPGMTEDVANAILDWLDEDDEPREYGAEVDYYSTLDPPYAPRNGPLAALDELLMVRGVAPELLFGVDANRNGYADETESDPSTVVGVDSSLGSMESGWARYLTLFSLESNLQSDGQPKIHVNQDDLQALSDELEEAIDPQWAKYIVAYRLQEQANSGQANSGQQQDDQDNSKQPESGPQTGPNADSPGPTGSGQNPQDQDRKQDENPTLTPSDGEGTLDLSQSPKVKINSILDLIDAKIRVKYQGREEAVEMACPFASEKAGEYLTELMDVLATDTAAVIAGRLNINEAPQALLAAIPEITSETVDAILSQRQAAVESDSADRRHATWLLTEGIVDLETMKKLLPYVTGRGSVYRAQVIGFFDRDGPSARIEAVFDATQRPARIVFWNELTLLGRGYPLESLGAETE
ncbi:MAG: general secretion pathway protein GspK [Rhodopirellula sp.]|nr:general secretion pathway protein GspK [Rhodopirellula sp.]